MDRSKTKEYSSWRAMKHRCENPAHDSYKYYGGRGIKCAEEWESFENFIEDMGVCPPGYSLERIDNNGDYFPENCKWASRAEQNRNRRDNIWLTANGRTQIQADWARELGVTEGAIHKRRKRGQSMQEIFDAIKVK
jgi:hypothetical protein